MGGCHILCCLQHDVGTFVGTAVLAYADEDVERMVDIEGGRRERELYGKRDVGELIHELLISDPVFVEACHDAVAVIGYHAVEMFLVCAYPLVAEEFGFGIKAHVVAKIEVAVTKRTLGGVDLCPVVVHAEGTQYDLAIVAAQIAVDRWQLTSFEFEEDGVDELHHIVAAHGRQGAEESPEEADIASHAKGALEIDVAWIAFPLVAITGYDTFVAEGFEATGKGGMDIGVVSKKEYSHSGRILTYMCLEIY